ncbi:hypothetical protein ACFV06_31865, partial [Streptomyces sp. NPDC059618]|uniref:hypothetical protein n=1 Tax=Streptomyces sp. NPDC059618 TaxID=3346887 RepID=UPI0036C32583
GPAGRESAGHRQDPAPDADELTYRPPPPPHPRPGAAPISTQPQLPDTDTAFASDAMTVHGGAEGAAPVSLTARQTARLTAWCRRHLITTEEFFAAALADSCARAAGQEEVALLTAVSLRQRYAERARLSEVGCFVRLVPATVRAGDSGALADRARGYGQALRAADADWRPVRQDHARIRRAVEFETEAGAGFGFRVTQDGCVDTALGHHAALVTRYTTTPYANTSYTGVTSRGVTSDANTTYGATYKSEHQAAYGLSWTAVRSAAPRQLGFLHLSRFRGALTVSLGMPNSTGIEGGSPERAVAGSGALTAPRIAAELAARALAPAT